MVQGKWVCRCVEAPRTAGVWVCRDIRVDLPVGGTVHSTTLPTEGGKEGEREGGREGGREEGRMRGRTGDYMYTVHVHVLYMQCTCIVHVVYM